uniref:Ig-like domain-containing protein n=1 Tax=Periophthalmus magnuspinnatus TaxID=409849 RepID=A0A3B4AS53_9GOBI
MPLKTSESAEKTPDTSSQSGPGLNQVCTKSGPNLNQVWTRVWTTNKLHLAQTQNQMVLTHTQILFSGFLKSSMPPQTQVNSSGSLLLFLCEVYAFPAATVEWRKEGQEGSLPGDDPHLSVQSRGGPLKFELSSWLQIERAGLQDAGTYQCVARNKLGTVSASAQLRIMTQVDIAVYLSEWRRQLNRN